MSIKKAFSTVVTYPTAKSFSVVPKTFTFQPENNTKYATAKKVTLQRAKELATKLADSDKGE